MGAGKRCINFETRRQNTPPGRFPTVRFEISLLSGGRRVCGEPLFAQPDSTTSHNPAPLCRDPYRTSVHHSTQSELDKSFSTTANPLRIARFWPYRPGQTLAPPEPPFRFNPAPLAPIAARTLPNHGVFFRSPYRLFQGAHQPPIRSRRAADGRRSRPRAQCPRRGQADRGQAGQRGLGLGRRQGLCWCRYRSAWKHIPFS